MSGHGGRCCHSRAGGWDRHIVSQAWCLASLAEMETAMFSERSHLKNKVERRLRKTFHCPRLSYVRAWRNVLSHMCTCTYTIHTQTHPQTYKHKHATHIQEQIKHVKGAGNPTAPKGVCVWKKMTGEEGRLGRPKPDRGLHYGKHSSAILYHNSFVKGDHCVKQLFHEGSVISHNYMWRAIVSVTVSKN